MRAVTNLTEMAEFFQSSSKSQEAKRVVGVAPRFWLPGDTYEQALARQQASFSKIAAKKKAGAL